MLSCAPFSGSCPQELEIKETIQYTQHPECQHSGVHTQAQHQKEFSWSFMGCPSGQNRFLALILKRMPGLATLQSRVGDFIRDILIQA